MSLVSQGAVSILLFETNAIHPSILMIAKCKSHFRFPVPLGPTEHDEKNIFAKSKATNRFQNCPP